MSLTEIISILDRSGSMGGLEKDTIGGFNGFIERQSKIDGRTLVTTVLFDDRYEVLWNGIDAQEIKLTNKEYFVRGMTALLDAVGKTILDVAHRLSKTHESQKPDKVIFVITTDGQENASREFTYPMVKKLIEDHKKEHGWEFIFMGANIDVSQEAESIGIDHSDAFQFEASKEGVRALYMDMDKAVMNKRIQIKKEQ